MDDLQSIYYLLGIAGALATGVIAIVKITSNLKDYVDKTVLGVKMELSAQIKDASERAEDTSDRSGKRFDSHLAHDEHMWSTIRSEVTALQATVAAHDRRFNSIEDLLRELRGDIKLLLTRKE